VSNGWQGGSTRRWRKVRLLVLARDGYACKIKLPGCTGKATHVHHTQGKQLGDDPAYLVASCEHCNLKTGDPTRHDPAPKFLTEW
jgi:5-methylcytosine-specific restriction endonuclease McrA